MAGDYIILYNFAQRSGPRASAVCIKYVQLAISGRKLGHNNFQLWFGAKIGATKGSSSGVGILVIQSEWVGWGVWVLRVFPCNIEFWARTKFHLLQYFKAKKATISITAI